MAVSIQQLIYYTLSEIRTGSLVLRNKQGTYVVHLIKCPEKSEASVQ